MGKKLYECRYELVYYAYAESEEQAAEFVSEAEKDSPASGEFVDVRQITKRHHALASPWNRYSFVYEEGDEPKELGMLLDQLPGGK